MAPRNTPPHSMTLSAKTGVSFIKMRILSAVFLCLEGLSVFYSNGNKVLYACFCLTTGLSKFYHTSAQMGISCINCVQEELRETNSQNSQPAQILRYFKKYCIHVFCIQFSVALETVNPKI